MASKLTISNLSKSFDNLEALRGIDLAVERGEFHFRGGTERLRKDHVPAHHRGPRARHVRKVLLDGREVLKPGGDRALCFQNTICCRGAAYSPTP